MGGVLADAELIDRWERLIQDGDRDPCVREFFREVAGYSDDRDRRARALAGLGAAQAGAARRSRASCVRSSRFRLDRDALARLATPTLMLLGSESPEWARRSTEAYSEALPHAELRILEGHGHGANTSGPELLARRGGALLRPERSRCTHARDHDSIPQ